MFMLYNSTTTTTPDIHHIGHPPHQTSTTPQYTFSKNVHSPTLCPKGTQKPSNLHSSPNCWHDISNTNIHIQLTVVDVPFYTWCGGCLVWWMSFFTYGVVDVWCGGCLVWWMSGVVDVRCGGCLILHTVWWMSGVVDVWCGGCLCGGCRTIMMMMINRMCCCD